MACPPAFDLTPDEAFLITIIDSTAILVSATAVISVVAIGMKIAQPLIIIAVIAPV